MLSHVSLKKDFIENGFKALAVAIGNKNYDFLQKLFFTNDIAVDKFLKLESGYNTYLEQFNLLELCLENVEWLLDILIDDYQIKDLLQPYDFRFRNEPDRLRFRGEIVKDNDYFFQVSALHMAVYFSKKWAVGQLSKYRSINKLLESGASASIMTMTRISAFSPIHLAIDINDPHVLSILLPHASTRHLFNEFHPYLWFAAEKKSSQMIQLLMDKFRESDDYWSRFYLIENFMGAYVGGLKSLICNNIGKYDVDVFKFLLNHAHFSEDQLNDLKLDPIFKDPKNSEYLTVINDQLSCEINRNLC